MFELTKIIKKKAYETENYLAIVEAITWEERTMNYLPVFKEICQIQNSLVNERTEIMKLILNGFLYQDLKAKAYALIKDKRFLIKKEPYMEIQSEFKLFFERHPPLTQRAKCDQYYAWGTLCFYHSNFSESCKNYRAILLQLNSHPYLMADPHQISYMQSVHNYLISAIYNNQFGKYEKDLLQQVTCSNHKELGNDLVLYRLELFFLLRTGAFQEAKNLINNKTFKKKTFFKVDFHIEYGYWFDVILTYFLCEDYKIAIKKINQLTRYTSAELPEDIFRIIRFIEVLIHYKLDDYDLVNQLTKAFILHCKKNETDDYFNAEILTLLNSSLQANNETRRDKHLIKLKTEIESKASVEMFVCMSGYFDLKKWLFKHVLSKSSFTSIA